MEKTIILKVKVNTNTPIKVSKFNMKGKYLCTYRSAYLAAQENGGSRVCIFQCCKGKQEDHMNFIWKYYNEACAGQKSS